MTTPDSPAPHPTSRGTATREVFVAFLRLGLMSFGGPVAHLGFFREAFVVRRRWLTDRAYADLVALCQFLPGPASSQVGMAIGLRRAGLGGLLAAWAGFTLPSAVLLVVFASGVAGFGDDAGAGWNGGLKAAAVAVVAQAVLGMARTLTPDARRATIAGAATIVTLLAPPVLGLPVALSQVAVIVLAGVAVACLAVFGLLLVTLPLLATVSGDGVTRLVDLFYRAGSLVFGGGHVVLPLLQAEAVPSGLVGHDQFLAGYGAAQAVPDALTGVNAGVVGLLATALYDPVFTQGVLAAGDPLVATAVVVAAFCALTLWAAPPWAVVIAAAPLGWAVL